LAGKECVVVRVWRQRELSLDQRLLDRCVATIGVFDGVHRGHQFMIDRALARAAELRLPAVALTFDPMPEEVLVPHAAPPRLTTLERRIELLGALGVDGVYVADFTPEFSLQSPEQFVRSLLVGALRVVAVVVGENFRFGRRAAGDVRMLRELGASAGFMVDAVSLLSPSAPTDGDPVLSSTWIRAQVAAGNVEAAASALGRPHRLEGVVVHGDHRGRDLGYPTANLDVAPRLAIPADGVYAGWLDGLPAAISIGTNPTFEGKTRRVEAYVIDRADLDLYGRRVALDIVTRLRDMVAFDGVEALLAQMADDVRRSRELLQLP
jgi:riboflavin kinase/FMN adenylyltransferase